MNIIVPRSCTEITDKAAQQGQASVPRPLEEFRDTPAYVLLGDPGSGKTTAFEVESEATENACLVSAREFLTFDVNDHPEWRNKTLFIDGLDEVRAGTSDARTPFDTIRRRLDTLGRPRFRLSCRQADWLGNNDLTNLKSVSPDSNVTSLRLDPLENSDVAEILKASPHVDDAAAFIAEARDRRIYGLLTNPQSLDLLVKAVAGNGSWPESRLEMFERACHQMVLEHNEEHRAVRESSPIADHTPTPKELLDAAGRLCAVQLLSGAAGYTSGLRQPSENYPAVDKCDGISLNLLRFTRSTKLFKGESDNRFAPVHRHIAEFLGARHLAELIRDRLPAQRVISLMTGEDGIVVTEMRGLSAWLAALCREARSALSERDPVGVGLYGDIRGFSHDEKRELLDSLSRESNRLYSDGFIWETAAAFGALATSDMEPVLKEVLNDSGREEKEQLFAEFVLNVLCCGNPRGNLAEILLKAVHDDTRSPSVKRSALYAFIYNCPESSEKIDKLKGLLEAIHSEKLPDRDDELLGTLLTHLYPDILSPAEVFRYLHEPKADMPGIYLNFWEENLIQSSSDDETYELLDLLVEQQETLRPILEKDPFREMSIELLARSLESSKDTPSIHRLYGWLSIGLTSDQIGGFYAYQRVRSWLEEHPAIQKSIIVEGLAQCSDSNESWEWEVFDIDKRLYGTRLPSDFGIWCQKKASEATDRRVAEYFVKQANDAGIPLGRLRKYIPGNAKLQNIIAERAKEGDEANKKIRDGTHQYQSRQEEWNRGQKEQINYVRSNEPAFLENRAAPDLLYRMARDYFGLLTNSSGENRAKALAKQLGGDKELVDVVLQGFQGVVSRNDVPDIKEILDLKQKDKRHYLGLPFLAGLAELERSSPEALDRLNEHQIRKATTFYYCTPHGGYNPDWYSTVLATRPDLVADIQIGFAVSEFRCGRDPIYKLWQLAHDAAYAEVARLATLPLLRASPTRCKSKQLESLKNLLWAAITRIDRSLLQGLIEKKLSLKSMNGIQRVYWLIAGVIVSPESYQDRLKDFVQGQKYRIHHLVTFLSNDDPVRFSLEELEISIQDLLIRLIGSYAGPHEALKEGFVTSGMRASDLVRRLVRCLATSPTAPASDALNSLLADPSLSLWRSQLSRSLDSQLVIRRDAHYHHPDIALVCETLNGGTPANPGDLAALVVDRLHEIAAQIREGNTDGWKKYWNVDSYGRPTDPRPENNCRDTLLDDLHHRLPNDLNAQPEGQYTDDKRADIRIDYHGFQIPIEIKKNSHRHVWSALQNQLIKQYTRDPATEGYGIYLIFWFGKHGQKETPPPPSGTRPANAEEMKEKLEATLSQDQARKISVHVIDVSRPEGSATTDESNP